MVFLPKDVIMSAEESANVIRVSETDPYNEDWTPAFDARDSVSLKTDEKFTDWYDVFENLGEGKFGKVYRCVEKSTKLELAAKCIRLKRDADKKQVEKEVSFMTRMRHKCIAQIYDAFVASANEVVLIMEIVHGGELFDRVVEENYILTETAVAMIVYQICEAIRYIHSHNIIHLDLKPENIMCVSQTGNQIKLIDFGLAQYYDGEHDLLFMAGTPEFAAPEVIKFEPLDFHTDMWSVGVIVYILLSGESPFLGDNLALTYYNVERGLWEFCEEFEENGVSEEAKDFINKLLILDKSQRMLPNDCLQHPWILNHREKARQIAQLKVEDDSSKIDTTKLRNYVKNKRFRRAVFGVLFINTIVRTFRTLKEKHCESGVKYVQTMLDAVKHEKEKTDEETPLLKRAASMIKRKHIIEEGEPGPSTIISKEHDKQQRVDSGLGESSTKVSAIEEEIKILETNSENFPVNLKEHDLENLTIKLEKQNEVSSKIGGKHGNENTTFKKIKKPKKASSEASQDSALSPLVNVSILTEKEAKDMNTRLTRAEAPDQVPELLTTTSSSAAVTSTTTATSEDENPPKVKKIIRKKKVPKPVLTLRDVEVPVVKYADDTKKTSIAKKAKKKSLENILETSSKTSPESPKKEESPENKSSSDIMENVETQPIQALIARRKSSAKPGGLVGNLLAKLEQKQEQKPPMRLAVSGAIPKRISDGLPKPALWNAASDVVKINGQNAKIEKIQEEPIIDEKKSNIEIPIQLERKIVSEKRTSIKKKAIKAENSMADEKIQQSEKSSVSKCEVEIETKTNIQEGNQNSCNSSKALYEKQTKVIEKERLENSTSEIKKIFAEKILDNSQKLGLSQIKIENGKKIIATSLKLKDKEENKTIIGAKLRNDESNGAIVLEQKKVQEINVMLNDEEKSTNVQTKQKIMATTKPPKPPSNSSTMKKKKIGTKNKNRSLDDLLDKNDTESSLNKKNVTFSNEILDSKIEQEQNSFSPFQRTQSTGNISNKEQTSTQSLDHVPGRKKSLLNPEEIEQLQAKERDAYNFDSLKNLLERRVSGDPPVDEYEQWRKAKAEEVRNSLHDSSNIKRAMKKWISMDKQNQQ
uniref:Protein kinase domain-containing protein n=1 Tax=Panagrolaimus sp. JU765 TaxID=591449 RepID=A0AC34QJZ2_9BILA